MIETTERPGLNIVPEGAVAPLRLLICGDLDVSGFGTVTTEIGRALLKRGADVRFLADPKVATEVGEPFGSRTAWIGQGWLEISDDGVEHFGRMFTGGGFEDGWTPNTTLLIGDPGSLLGNPILRVIPEGFSAWHYAPVEGIGLPPAWASIWAVAKPIAMSRFGADEIEKASGKRPPFVYHGVDGDVFREATGLRPLVVDGTILRSKGACKSFFGLDPKRIMLLRTDRYMPRKAYPSMLRAVMPVMAAHPEIDLVIHCRPRDLGGDIRVELSKYGSALGRRVMLTGGKLPREGLVALYNAADLYLSSGAEGFGLTIAEALACGTPALGLDFTAVPEVIGMGGQVVPVGQYVDSIYSILWAYPDEAQYAKAVEFLITHHTKRRQLGMLGAMHVRGNFDWSRAASEFEAIFTGAVAEAVAP